ncbi:MAG: hypothetical protein ACLRL6_12085 [Clostridium sp.]
MQIMVEHPFILDFICRAFSSRREAVSSDVAMELHSLMDTTFDRFLRMWITQNLTMMLIRSRCIRCWYG